MRAFVEGAVLRGAARLNGGRVTPLSGRRATGGGGIGREEPGGGGIGRDAGGPPGPVGPPTRFGCAGRTAGIVGEVWAAGACGAGCTG